MEAETLVGFVGDTAENKRRPTPNPARFLATGFLGAIAVGTLLLSLPPATVDGRGLAFLDAFFMATSATCVTGLVVVDVGATMSRFGQLVILALFQIGGLGIMTVTTLFAVAIGRKVSLSERLSVGEALGHPRLSGVLLLVRKVVAVALTIEAVGAVLLTAAFRADYPLGEAVFRGVFHSVSAFCNAGFDLFGTSLLGYATHVPVNLTFIALIVIGGLGFYVLAELIGLRRPDRLRLTLHSRMVLRATLVLIIVGTLAVFVLEHANPETLGPLNTGEKLLASLFLSVTSRTAGFNSVPTAGLIPSTLLLVMILMYIGAAPGSTGGGIKVTVVVAVLASVRAALRRREDVDLSGRRLPAELVIKAWVIAAVFLAVILLVLMLLLVTEDAPFLAILFETVSAAGTVGLSTGLTPDLSPMGRLILPCLMYFGRVGPLTLAVALARRRVGSGEWHLPEERIYVG